ncbi:MULTISPECIES: nucleotidyltransferase domain-containing protein [Metallosphaera]|uniref:nucleotidyltransferase domain-containing protein n=1 Tax=Metallosphaera TaxID=41980 RepID=UPI001F05B5E1|nr:nucleotidyltransferase domain-containing protein [Metallosphaera sedula]MCH1772150.1 nucleotidyltransferase domain-containing protein [Metallosphaera sedula]MCP6727695.1 nucleotidyltransferase domain-containing protein [Metallosphaera sedula]
MPEPLELSRYLDRLRAFNWRDFDVYYAILFGSLAKRGRGNDVDIAVEFKRKSLEAYSSLLASLRDYLDDDRVDLVMISDNSDCFLVHEVFSDSLILYMEDYDRMHRIASICEDFLIDLKKLQILENAGRAIMRRWQS